MYKRVDNLVDEILEKCKEQEIDVKLICDKLNLVWLPETSPEFKKQLQDAYENDEFNMSEFEEMTPKPTEEEMEQQMLDELDYMSECRESINYVCYEANCPNRIKDKLFVGMVDCDSYEELGDDLDVIKEDSPNNSLRDDSNVNLMTDLDDIASSVLSDIYGGTY